MTKHFYRIGNQSTGLWYNKFGDFTGDIHTKNFNWLNASQLEMPFDNELVGFLSVADSLEHLYQWFSQEEILKLHEKDFYIEEWVATTYKFYDLYQHNVICQKTSILKNKLKIITEPVKTDVFEAGWSVMLFGILCFVVIFATMWLLSYIAPIK